MCNGHHNLLKSIHVVAIAHTLTRPRHIDISEYFVRDGLVSSKFNALLTFQCQHLLHNGPYLHRHHRGRISRLGAHAKRYTGHWGRHKTLSEYHYLSLCEFPTSIQWFVSFSTYRDGRPCDKISRFFFHSYQKSQTHQSRIKIFRQLSPS